MKANQLLDATTGVRAPIAHHYFVRIEMKLARIKETAFMKPRDFQSRGFYPRRKGHDPTD